MYIVCCSVNINNNIVNSSLYRFLQLAGLTYRSLSSKSSMEQWCDLQTQQPKAHFWGLLSNKTCYHDSFIRFLHCGSLWRPRIDSSTNQKKITPKKENNKKTLSICFTAAPVEHRVTQQQQQQQSFIVLLIQKCKDIKKKREQSHSEIAKAGLRSERLQMRPAPQLLIPLVCVFVFTIRPKKNFLIVNYA